MYTWRVYRHTCHKAYVEVKVSSFYLYWVLRIELRWGGADYAANASTYCINYCSTTVIKPNGQGTYRRKFKGLMGQRQSGGMVPVTATENSWTQTGSRKSQLRVAQGSEPTPSDTPPSARPHLLSIHKRPPTGNQVFKYPFPWGTFSLKLPHALSHLASLDILIMVLNCVEE